MTAKHRSFRPLAATALGIGVLVASAGPAAAHVTVSSDTTEPGEYALLAFSVPHGCAGSPTTEVEIELPIEGIGPVTPSVNPAWEVNRVRDDNDNVTAVVYTASDPLAADLRDSFEVSTLILPNATGELVFPVVQRCEQGQEIWDEVAATDEDPHDLDHPAPFLTISSPGAGEQRDTTGGSTVLAGSGLGLGAIALIISIVALRRTRHHTTSRQST